mmetsp:Transcript_2726/g.8816  ORF Transcript_2726/g.8816 Transcript_2726/m.8816 type:complete len:210 (+) Transcript_2726:402-1031(+)
MHSLLVLAPAHAPLLERPLALVAQAVLQGPCEGQGEGYSELSLATFGGVAGRALLVAPSTFEAALSSAASALGVAEPLPAFCFAWLAVCDGMLLSSQRRLAALALAALLPLEPKALGCLEEVLSLCVSALADEEQPPPSPARSPPPEAVRAAFSRALEPFDSLAAMPLRPALQRSLGVAQEAHGAAFGAAIARVDPALLEQVRAAFGTV